MRENIEEVANIQKYIQKCIQENPDDFLLKVFEFLAASQTKQINEKVVELEDFSFNLEYLSAINKAFLNSDPKYKKEILSVFEQKAQAQMLCFKDDEVRNVVCNLPSVREEYEINLKRIIDKLSVSGSEEDCKELIICLFFNILINKKKTLEFIEVSCETENLYLKNKNLLLSSNIEKIKNIKYLDVIEESDGIRFLLDSDLHVFLFHCAIFKFKQNKGGYNKIKIDKEINELNFKFFVNRLIFDKNFIKLMGIRDNRKNFLF